MVLEFFAGKVFFFFLVSLAISWFVLLSHIGHLMTNDETRASLPSLQLLVMDTVRFVFCAFCFFPPSYAALWDSKTPHRHASESVLYCVETSPRSWLPPQDGSMSLSLSFLIFSFILWPTETNKASGGDGIPVELFQILKDDAVKVLHSICQQIWKTQ